MQHRGPLHAFPLAIEKHVRSSRDLIRWLVLALLAIALTACDFLPDPATRIANDLESASGLLGKDQGSTYTLQHKTPSKVGECVGPYKVQFDKVGGLVMWCYDNTGKVVSSHSTTYHDTYVDTAETYILDKPAGSTLTIDLERHGQRAVIVSVH